jgi:hypothetical protein
VTATHSAVPTCKVLASFLLLFRLFLAFQSFLIFQLIAHTSAPLKI